MGHEDNVRPKQLGLARPHSIQKLMPYSMQVPAAVHSWMLSSVPPPLLLVPEHLEHCTPAQEHQTWNAGTFALDMKTMTTPDLDSYLFRASLTCSYSSTSWLLLSASFICRFVTEWSWEWRCPRSSVLAPSHFLYNCLQLGILLGHELQWAVVANHQVSNGPTITTTQSTLRGWLNILGVSRWNTSNSPAAQHT